jgi:hypothetical protein
MKPTDVITDGLRLCAVRGDVGVIEHVVDAVNMI